MVQFVTAYDESYRGDDVAIDYRERLTKDADADSCDINRIMERYKRDGLIEHVAMAQGQYGDFTEGFDFREVQDRIVKANELFEVLPSDMRKQFDNDPAAFFEFVADPANKDLMQEMGLLDGVSPSSENPPAEPPTGSSEPVSEGG